MDFFEADILTAIEKKEIAKQLLDAHQEMQQRFITLENDAADPGVYKITLREQKRFIAEFMKSFYAYLKNYNQEIDENTKHAAIGKAWESANTIYLDMFPFPLDSNKTSAIDDTYHKVKRALRNDIPTLFIRPLDSLDLLETVLSMMQARHGNLHIETVTGTPFMDRAQIIGAWLPSEKQKGTLEFKKGILCNLVEIASLNPDSNYIFKLDQVEAIPPKIRAMLNQFLLIGEMEIPEINVKITWPKNLKMIATITEGSILEDSAFYDRFLRKYLFKLSIDDLRKILKDEYKLPDLAVEKLISIYKRETLSDVMPSNIMISVGHLFLVVSYIRGRIKDSSKFLNPPKIEQIVEDELRLFFKQSKISHSLEWDEKERCILIDKVPLYLEEHITYELECRIHSCLKPASEEIKSVVYEKTGLILTSDALHALSGIVRSLRYGSQIVRLEGPTGIGKTFIAECLARLLGISFYGEPIHGESKQSKWIGVFKPDRNGDYYLDMTTPFLQTLKEGGIIALSELNTAVKDGYAKLGWWLIPLARGMKKIILNEYPVFSMPYPTLSKSQASLIIIDINPEETYEARGKMPPLLEALTPTLWIDGLLSQDEIETIVFNQLYHFPVEERKQIAEWLAQVHYKIQQELRQPARKISKDSDYVISLREIKRCCEMIVQNYGKRSTEENFLYAVITFYLLSLKDNSEREYLLQKLSVDFGAHLVLQYLRYAPLAMAKSGEKVWKRASRSSYLPIRFLTHILRWSFGIPYFFWLNLKNPLNVQTVEEVEIIPSRSICIDERSQTLQELFITLKGHYGTVQAVEIIKDERSRIVVISGGYDRTIKIWTEFKSNQCEVRTLPGHEDTIVAISTLKSQTRSLIIVSGSKDGVIKVWREISPYKFSVRTLKGLKSLTYLKAFKDSKGSLTIVAGTMSHKVEIWKEGSGGRFHVTRYQCPFGMRSSYIVQKRNRSCVIVSKYCDFIRICTPGSYGYMHTKNLDDTNWNTSLIALLDNHDRLIIISESTDVSLKIWRENMQGTFQMEKLQGQQGQSFIMDAMKDKYGRLIIASANNEGKIKIWREYDKENFKVRVLEDHPNIQALSILREEEDTITFVTAGNDRTIRIWKLDYDIQKPHAEQMYTKKLVDAYKNSMDAYLKDVVFNLRYPTLIFLPPQNNFWRHLGKIIRKTYPNAYIEKVRAGEFLDEFSLLGGYIVDEMAQSSRKFKWADGILPRIFKDAEKEALKDAHGIAKHFFVFFENYHYLRARIAVSLNSILQEGRYYLPTEQSFRKVSPNIHFLSLASYGEKLSLSLAEQSRWVRIYFSELDVQQGNNLVYPTEETNLPYPIEQDRSEEYFQEWENFIKELNNEIDGIKSNQQTENAQQNIQHTDQEARTQNSQHTGQEREMEENLNTLCPVVNPEFRLPDEKLLVATFELLQIESKIIEAWNSSKVVILQGAPGVGKTDVAIDMANRFGLPFFVYSAHSRSHLQDLIGNYTQDTMGNFVLTAKSEDGHYRVPFIELFVHGGIFIIDEGAVGRKAQGLIAWLTGIAKKEEELFINEHPGYSLVLKKHTNFHIIITTNPPEITVGREEIPKELASWAVTIQFPEYGNRSYHTIIERFYDLCLGKHPGYESIFQEKPQQVFSAILPQMPTKSSQDTQKYDYRMQSSSQMSILTQGVEYLELELETSPAKNGTKSQDGQNGAISDSSKEAKTPDAPDASEIDSQIFSVSNTKRDWIRLQLCVHHNIKALVRSVDNPDNHLITLRDLKNWVKTAFFLYKSTNSWPLALVQSLSLIYLQQFDKNFQQTILSEEILKFDYYAVDKQIHDIWFQTIRTESERKNKEKAESAQKPREKEEKNESFSTYLTKSEESTLKSIHTLLEVGFNVLLMLEPGAREHEIITALREKTKSTFFHLESSPDMVIEDLIGGVFPVFPDEEMFDIRKLRIKPGFLSRHLQDAEPVEISSVEKLLVIHNIDAMSERVRVALNNFLLKGYLEQKDDSGKVSKKYLPSDVRIVATISLSSSRDISSAFLNRFVKLHVESPKAFTEGFSDFLNLLMDEYCLSEQEARFVQQIYLMVHELESEGGFWPSSKTYNFTLHEAILHGRFISYAQKECQNKNKLSTEQIVVYEALRVYGTILQEHERDYNNFVQIVLKTIFSHEYVHDLPYDVGTDMMGIPKTFSHVPLVSPGIEKPSSFDTRFRLTLVPPIVKTISCILRGWQAGKMVCLIGETGVAKTTLGIFLAKLMGLDYYIYSTHGESKSRDLTFSLRLTPDGLYEFEQQEFLKRIQKGYQIIILDEINIRPHILWILTGIVRGESMFTLEFPDEKPFDVEIGKNVYFLLTMNPESYAGRSNIPFIFWENIVKIWVSGQYSLIESQRILEDFLLAEEEIRGKQKKPSNAVQELKNWLQNKDGLYYRTVDELLQLIEEKGNQAIATIPPHEIRELEKEILANLDVQKKMEFIRSAVKISARDVQIVFTLYGWWAESTDGKVIIVPLYELVNSKRSQEAIIGLILHEIRHKRFTLGKADIQKIATEFDAEACMNNPGFHLLFNVVEDIRIDSIRDPSLIGENQYIQAMNKEFFKPMTETEQKKSLEMISTRPDKTFLYELVVYGYRHIHSEIFQSLPDEIKDAVKKVVKGLRPLLYMAAWHNSVVPDFAGIVQGMKKKEEEKLKAAKKSIEVVIKKIFPIYEKILGKSQRGDEGAGGNVNGSVGGGAPYGVAGMAGPPQVMEVTSEELRTILENSAPASLPPGMNVQQVVLLVKDAESTVSNTSAASNPGLQEQESLRDRTEQRKPQPSQMNEEERERQNRDFSQAMATARRRRQDEIRENEPLNLRLLEVSNLGKKLAKGLLQSFQDYDEPEIEESATGRVINPLRYLLRSQEPFDEEMETIGKPNLSLGITIDTSGSMRIYLPVVKRMVAIILSSFLEIGKKKAEYSISFITEVFDLIKPFKETYSVGMLNEKQREIENWMDGGGRVRPGGGIHLYNAVCGIIDKYKDTHKTNKIEIVLTDGQDTGGDLSYVQYKPSASKRLQEKMTEASKQRIEIVGIGLNTQDTEVFGRFVQLPQDKADSLVEALLRIAKCKAERRTLPNGNLCEKLGIYF